MQDFLNSVSAFFAGVSDSFVQWLSNLSPQYVGLILLALLLVILVLVILLALRGRKYNEAMDLIDQQVDAIIAAKRDAQAMIDQKSREQQDREQQMMEQLNQREQTSNASIADKERAFTEKHDELLRLRLFHEQYKGIDDAKVEIKRLLGEAHDYVDELKSRADREYTEIIGHAQDEAASIRDMSQGMMKRSHELLKKTLDRSRELIDDAKREAGLPIAQIPEGVRQALRELTEMDQEATGQGAAEQIVSGEVPEPNTGEPDLDDQQ